MPGNGAACSRCRRSAAAVWVEFERDLSQPIRSWLWADAHIDPASDAAPQVKFWNTKTVTVRIDHVAGESMIESRAAPSSPSLPPGIKAEASTASQKTLGSPTQLSASGFEINNGGFVVI